VTVVFAAVVPEIVAALPKVTFAVEMATVTVVGGFGAARTTAGTTQQAHAVAMASTR
jgi:hypothetical protein